MPFRRPTARSPDLRRDGLSLVPLAVRTVDLSPPLGALELGPGYRAAYVLLRRDGVPLDTLIMPAEDGCVPTERLSAALSRKPNLDAPRRGRPELPPAPPRVTVAVCTRDRPDDLSRCLTALRALDYPRLELLVVDNAPSDDRTLRLVTERFPEVRYALEKPPGLDRARNRAIVEAQGEILAFTDDDVVVDPGWVRAIVAAFDEHPDAACVTGLTLPFELETPAQVIFEVNGSFARGFEQQRFEKGAGRRYTHLHPGLFGAGANMAFRRATFDAIGPFDPFLDVGTPTNGGGDIEMFFRVVEEGYPLLYEPRALVWHRHRREMDALGRQFAGWGSYYAFLIRTARHYPHLRAAIVRRGLWWLLRRHLLRWAAHPFRRTIVPASLMWAELRGCLDGLTSYERSQRLSHAKDEPIRSSRAPAAEARTSG